MVCNVGRIKVIYTQEAFVLPGDYQVAMGLFVTGTKEHAVTHKTVRVDALHHDPLPDAWRDLPEVAFLPGADTPESWYWPSVDGRLNLPIACQRPLRIELLVNGSSTEQLMKTMALRSRLVTIGTLLPAMKVLSQITIATGSRKVALLDLERRRVDFEQTLEGGLDWSKLKDALGQADPYKIDFASLLNRGQNAQFFLSEVQKRVSVAEDAGPLRVLIILSGPMAFGHANLSPIQATVGPNCAVFYIRYNVRVVDFPPPTPMNFPDSQGGRGGGGIGGLTRPNPTPLPTDELFGLLQPLQPKLFDVATPQEFRRALAGILSDIARFANAWQGTALPYDARQSRHGQM
jgi:hypothetical protein